MKKGNRILGLCAALFALIIIGGLVHTSPALAWDTWPAGTHNDPNHVWTVVFDKAMNTSTINSQNIYVSNDIQGSSRVTGVSVKASNSTHALVSPPAGGWKSGASYYLIITQKVLTSANRPLKDEVRMPFHIKTVTKAVPKPVSLEVRGKGELWVKYSDGHKELLVNVAPGFLDNSQFSLDGTKVYYSTCAGTAAGCETYMVNIKDKTVKDITDGYFVKVIDKGVYKGNIIVSKHLYYGPPNYGSYDEKYVVNDNGNTLAKFNQ